MGESASIALAALRALYEGAPATFDMLALAAGRSEARLRATADREGWRTPEPAAHAADPEARLSLLSDRVIGELEKVSREGEETGAYDKVRLDALAAMLRMVEKIGEMGRGPQSAREEQMRSDEEMAAALARIDARILELAEDLAGRLATQMGVNKSAEEAGAGD